MAVAEDGTIDTGIIKFLEELAKAPLQIMRDKGELSAFNVTIDAAQKVLATKRLQIRVSLVPIGVANHIEVSIGYTLQIN